MGVGAAGLLPNLYRAKLLHPKTGKPMVVPGQDGGATLLFNGWRITPAGRHLRTGDMLLGGAFSPDGKLLAITNCGWNFHTLHIVDVQTEKEVGNFILGRAWNGIAWSSDGKRLYVAGGISNSTNDVYLFARGEDGSWEKQTGLTLTGNSNKATCIAGIALSSDDKTLFALNNSDDHLYVLDTESGKTLARTQVGDHPIACRLSQNGQQLYIANWGGSEVVVVDIQNSTQPKLTAHLPTGDHPNDLALSQDEANLKSKTQNPKSEGRLFVSCGNADAVTVYDTQTQKPLETLKTTLTPNSPSGSTPNALALSPDGKTLYVANADNNSVCVVDVSRKGKSHVKGFLPTGWYPSAVLVSPDGTKVIIGSGKGKGSGPNPAKLPLDSVVPKGFDYIASQLKGLLSFVDTPTDIQLAAFTKQVYANTPYHDSQLKQTVASEKTVIPTRVGVSSPIKHILYIIKENRTYDQVFGDMKEGNGDANLCLFGREVTPNHHALAEQFVLLDNLYCNGEVSADGHPWSTAAYATDFIQRSWVLSYSAKGSTHYTDSVADAHTGYLWDACARKGLTYRSYGEYTYATSSQSAPELKMEGSPGLKGHGSPSFVGIGRAGNLPPMRDPDRADAFIAEFREFERKGTLPSFMIMALGEDHTNGTSTGSFTPKAMVASNDQALGKIVEAVSHSSAWKNTAIFVIEDDAQNGPDHVDSHRTIGLVISPYTKHKVVDSTMYSTTSLLRTMELLLGLPPLSQYDAAATPMFASFTNQADAMPYTLLPPRIDLTDRNPASAYGAAESSKMDWSGYDRINEDALNRILWHSIKGRQTPYPTPVRRVLPFSSATQHDEDDK